MSPLDLSLGISRARAGIARSRVLADEDGSSEVGDSPSFASALSGRRNRGMFRGVGWRRRHSQEEIERAARVLGVPVPVPGSRGSSRGRVLPTDGGWERCSTSSSGEVESTRPSVVPPRRSGQRRTRRPGDGWEADDELRKGSGERSEEEIAWSVGSEERPSTPPRVGFCEGEGGEEAVVSKRGVVKRMVVSKEKRVVMIRRERGQGLLAGLRGKARREGGGQNHRLLKRLRSQRLT